MKNLRVIRENILVHKLLLLEGYSRAGKFLLGKILDGFEGVEHFQHVSLIEQLPYLVRLGVLDEDVAVSMMRVSIDENAYHMRIGRNLNFRKEDSSSLLKFVRIGEYIERSFSGIDPDIVKYFKKDAPCSVFVAHEALPNMKIFFKAYPSLKTISLQRHPVDLIYSWWQRGWGDRETKDPLCFHPSFQMKSRIVPWYACGWHEKYKKFRPIDRVIMIMKTLDRMSRQGYKALSLEKRKNVLFITHEALIEDSWEVIKRIKSFLGIPPTDFMAHILTREKCLRALPADRNKEKIKKIRRKASKKMFEEMMKLAERYEFYSGENTLEKLYLS